MSQFGHNGHEFHGPAPATWSQVPAGRQNSMVYEAGGWQATAAAWDLRSGILDGQMYGQPALLLNSSDLLPSTSCLSTSPPDSSLGHLISQLKQLTGLAQPSQDIWPPSEHGATRLKSVRTGVKQKHTLI